MNEQKRILITTAVSVEKEAVLNGLHDISRFDVVEVGVGPIEAAARTAIALVKGNYSMVLNVGIAGGFPNKAQIGSIVIANKIVAADLGAETDNGFYSLDSLGFGKASMNVDENLVENLYQALLKGSISVNKGTILTVSTVTGTKETAEMLEDRIPNATAEAMEGFGVATAAAQFNLPFLEVRAISNIVGPRNKEEWRIKDALLAIEEAMPSVMEVIK